jgi:hypothetical protein
LLLAAYLASNNPQESDSTTFGNELKGRRKRQCAGQDPDQESSQPHSKDSQLFPSRTFGLERLLTIYAKILPSISIPVLSSLWWHPSAARQQREESNLAKNGDSEKNKRVSLMDNAMIFEIEQKLLYYGHSESHVYSAVSISLPLPFSLRDSPFLMGLLIDQLFGS